jgi:hypothetical protein
LRRLLRSFSAAAVCVYSRAFRLPCTIRQFSCGRVGAEKPPFRYFFAVMALVDLVVKMRLACSIK